MKAIITENLTPPAGRVDPGAPPILDWLAIDRLVIDAEYQRPIGKDGRRAIERIAREFSWAKFSTVIVAPVSLGRYAIIDGQHRTTAAKLCGYERVPCQVLKLDQAEQAASFSAINGNITKVTSWVLYKAALAAGERWATDAKAACSAAGCTLMTYNKSAAAREAGELYGVSMVRDMIAKHGADTVTAALAAYRQSVYGDLPLAWNNVLVQAWVAAIGNLPALAKMAAADLAAFHDGFDIIEHDDAVQADIRAARKAGAQTPARWAALSTRIVEALTHWSERRAA